MGRQNKTIHELTIKDNFMFSAVMLDEENAKGFIELALGVKVERIDVTYEKSIVYNPEYKGVRLDVYLQDETGTHFNVEMQAASRKLLKRSRYYHSQIDMDLLRTGEDYEKLPDSYVIFICDFDPIGLGKYRYTVCHSIAEDADYRYEDGNNTVYLSTVGTNEKEVPEALVKFLKYVGAPLENSENDYYDDYVRHLQESIKRIKANRDMETRYMLFEEMMRDEYKAGKAEGLAEGKADLLSEMRDSIIKAIPGKIAITDDQRDRLQSISESSALMQLYSIATNIKNAEEFSLALDRLEV